MVSNFLQMVQSVILRLLHKFLDVLIQVILDPPYGVNVAKWDRQIFSAEDFQSTLDEVFDVLTFVV